MKSAGASIRMTPIPLSSRRRWERRGDLGTRPAAGAALPAALDSPAPSSTNWKETVLGRESLVGDPSVSGLVRSVQLDLTASERMAGDLACWSAFVVALVRLARDPAPAADPARKAISRGMLWSALLIVAAFLVNRNIFNSDNYRYLIFLLTPWSLGFGLVMHDLARRGWLGCCGVARRRTSGRGDDLGHVPWYRDERHYVDERGMPVRRPRSGLVGAARSRRRCPRDGLPVPGVSRFRRT